MRGSVALRSDRGDGESYERYERSQPARPKRVAMKRRCRGISLLGTAATCPLRSMFIVSTPAIVCRAVIKRLNPSIGPVRVHTAMILLDPIL